MKDFTEAARRRLQFAADLQLASAASRRRPTSIRYMRPLSGHATRWRRKAAVFMTNSPHRAMAADRRLLFIAIFDKCAGKCLFPVPFVTEW
ncbi:hypothetical protein RFM98_07580 [Mesorhizobium sp. VK9D]|uniref:hypothetical protein n=1 Tax=Mesorhizobium australafricanum TaxID=3072311 RepID=UPI002A246231|nr:hypothetical protein [Mesorhizobium sp. VK9D]MDX8452612.1 hypothetical protein [Mesorhizobium sp. VK9D]